MIIYSKMSQTGRTETEEIRLFSGQAAPGLLKLLGCGSSTAADLFLPVTPPSKRSVTAASIQEQVNAKTSRTMRLKQPTRDADTRLSATHEYGKSIFDLQKTCRREVWRV